MPATVAISSDFFTAFAALPKKIQSKVSDFIQKFKKDPQSPGINYEKIKDAADSKMCSVRIDDAYRGIVVRLKETGVFLLLWVDHHDEAYDWAKGRKCLVNQATGSIQVYDVGNTGEEQENCDECKGVFSKYSSNDLIKIGVPEEQLSLVRSFPSLDAFYRSKSVLPSDAYEYLEWLANDIPIEEIIEMVSEAKTEVAADDFGGALDSLGTQKSFMVVEGEDELEQMLSGPLEKWRVFLHPIQRRLVETTYTGPARALGGAGTGKTVVAMHRAKKIAASMRGNEKLLFTTYTANLADDIQSNLKSICTYQEMRHIEVVNLDQWVAQYLKRSGYRATIVYADELNSVWEEALSICGGEVEFPLAFYQDEWSRVVASQDAFSRDLYLQASRIGRGTRLDRKKRIQVWNVFDEYLRIMRTRQIRDIDTALYECRKLVEETASDSMYKSIIVDEGQDFSSNAYKLLRTLAGEEHENDIFIVGDTHQRIYKNYAVLSRCGINVRGRSSYLRINYRTTEEIRNYAFALLKGIPFDNMDAEVDEVKRCQSLTHGDKPAYSCYDSFDKEASALIDSIKELMAQGVTEKSICVVARTHKMINDYSAALVRNGIRVYEIRRSKTDDQNYEGIRVATMHRVKGLEFSYVYVVGMNKGAMPLSSAINYTDKPSEEESLTAEKCLLYVALTRAQKRVVISGFGTPSELFC